MPRTHTQLDDDLLTLLAPITRTRFDYVGTSVKATPVNPNGIDVHVGAVGTAAQDPDGTAHAYVLVSTGAKTPRHERLTRISASSTWTVQLTVAAGTRAGLRWALDRLATVTTNARLHPTTGFLLPYTEPGPGEYDQDATPPRWFIPLVYTATTR